MPIKKVELTDVHQTAWQIASIQLSGWTSLPIVATSLLVLQVNSFLGAVLTIIVGNALLWFLRLIIVSITYSKRQSTLDLARDYLGEVGGYFIAAVLLLSTLAWFLAQTTAASHSLTHLINFPENVKINQVVQISVILGIISSFLCMEGMPLLRKFTTLFFPILILLFLTILFTLPSSISVSNNHPLSLAGLPLILATNLGVTSDLPTFFRHSPSWHTSIKALTIVQIFSLAIALSGLYFSSLITESFEINHAAVLASDNSVLRISLIFFILFSVLCANVANVYSASVGWELLAPKALVGRKEYLILGLGLTTIFILVSDLLPIDILIAVSDDALINLCIVILVGYFIARFCHLTPSRFIQMIYFFAWLFATVGNAFQYDSFNPLPLSLLIIGSVMVVGFMVVRLSRRWIKLRK